MTELCKECSRSYERLDSENVLKEIRKMILIQIEDTENFPTPETWTDDLMIAIQTIIAKFVIPKHNQSLGNGKEEK